LDWELSSSLPPTTFYKRSASPCLVLQVVVAAVEAAVAVAVAAEAVVEVVVLEAVAASSTARNSAIITKRNCDGSPVSNNDSIAQTE